MTLSVVGAGFGRTGTFSIKLALERLGFGPCHHMDEVLTHTQQLPFWRNAVDGEGVDWEQAFAGYGASIDWPSTHYWRELAEDFPAAKVLLSVRPPDQWWASFSSTIRALLLKKDALPPGYHRDCLDMAHRMIVEQTFHGDLSEAAVIAEFQTRIDEVRSTIAADRLLVFNVADGWEPLCRFLEVEIPEEAFPRSNSRQEFWKQFGGQL